MPRTSLSRRVVAPLAVVAAIASAPALAAQHDHHGGARDGDLGKLGTVTFPNSGAAAAQPAFLRGLALLHSFEYEDAAEAFQEAQAADPSFAMAYWGEALTYKHPLWGQEDLDAARAALSRLAPAREARLAKARTERERAWLRSAEDLFFGEGDERTRSRAYEAALDAIRAAHPDDDEATALYALAVIANSLYLPPDGRRAGWLKATAVLEPVFARRPDHPGAAHYLIHAYDDPALAERGLPAARAYAGIAPAAEHALHMPSHIFVQRGMWDQVHASNAAATSASREWVARKRLTPGHRDWHAYEWQMYAELQRGRVASAREMVDSARALLASVPDSAAGGLRRSLALMTIHYAAETGEWRHVAAGPGVLTAYAQGMEAAERGDAAGVAGALARLRQMMEGNASPMQKLNMRVSAAHLEAAAARVAGRADEALEMLGAAAAIEDSTLASGPPTVVPAREQRAAALLAGGRHAEAADEYARVLARTPNRTSALLGRARAAARLGRAEEARELYARVVANWHAADTDLPALAEARRGAGAAVAAAGAP